jgi:hypothetical protein
VVSNINEFLRETNQEIEKLQKKQVSEAKKIVLLAYSEITELSPADTGLFRHNNILTVNRSTNETNDMALKNVGANISETMPTISGLKFKHNDEIYIQNNLSYADALEAGHSKQAPGISAIYGKTEDKIGQLIKGTTII